MHRSASHSAACCISALLALATLHAPDIARASGQIAARS